MTKMEIILIYVLVVALFAGIPMILDICLAYRSVKESGKAPRGIPGLARATMALTVIVILGIAVFHILVKGAPGDNSQIVNNILSMLAGLLAAITGFYFGGKAGEKKVEEAEEK